MQTQIPEQKKTIEIQKITEDGVTVLNLKGWLVSVTASDLEKAINAVLDEDNKLILDFSDVVFMASSGIRTLLLISKRVNQANGLLIVRNVSPDVMKVLEMTGLKNFLDIR